VSLFALTSQAQQRVPLFEVFSSSTCGPCNSGNAKYKGVVSAHPKSDYVSVKYQQDFPSPGDPYCTDETYARRQYYAINSIPRMEIDGLWDKNAGQFTEALYQSARAAAAKATVTGTYTIKNRVVTGKVKVTSLAALPAGSVLYIAISEEQTTKNVGNNGETLFFDIVKKMIPSNTGTTVALTTVGAKDSVSFTYKFPATYRLPADGKPANRINFNTTPKDTVSNSVEDFSKLNVVAWVQGPTGTKDVYQAAHITKVWPAAVSGLSQSINDVSVYPNPATKSVSIDLNMTGIDLVSAKLTSMSGAVVASQAVPCNVGKNTITIETANLANGIYNLIITDSKNYSFGQKVVVQH
jgi:hypothetical protein